MALAVGLWFCAQAGPVGGEVMTPQALWREALVDHFEQRCPERPSQRPWYSRSAQ